MKEKNGSIEQAMHGYSNGHRLLSSSQKFSDIDNKKMIILSDLSGNEFINGFEKYFTGYKLEDGRSVLACTWYAKEMSRPGCVWTHSLILNKISLSKENISYIFSIFRKPNIDDDFSFYSKSLHLQTSTEKFEVNNSKLKYIIWCVLKSKTPSVVFADSSILYEKELIYLFLAYNHILDSKFSFCTGAISLRTYENQIMQFQVVPYKLARSTWLMNNKVLTAKDENIIKEYPMWVNKIIEYIQIDNLKDISHFKSGFSTKYNQSKYFSSFVKLYVGTKADCKKLSLGNLLQLATAIFDDKEEICEEILQLYFQGYFYKWNEKEYISALQFFIENQWLYISRENIHDVVSKGFEYEYIKSKNLFKSIIRMEGNYIIEEILKTYAELLSYNQFVHFTDLEYES